MSDKPETIFADGLFFELPQANTPTFIKGKLSIEVEKFKQFLNDHQNKGGYVNIDLKESKGQKGYAVLNTWKPTQKQYKAPQTNEVSVPTGEGIEYPEEEVNPDDIPF